MRQERTNAALVQDLDLEALDHEEPSAEPQPEREPFVGNAVPGQARRRLLTREEESSLAKSLEDSNRAVLEAIAGSAAALAELVAILEERGAGGPETEPVVVAAEEELGAAESSTSLLDAARRARSAKARARRATGTRAGEPADDPRAQFVQTALRCTVSHGDIEKLLTRLVVVHRSSIGPARKAIERTAAAIRRGQRGAERARAILVESNLGLVVWMATKRTHPGLSLPDLIQEGTMGLMRAVEKFDHRRGIRFNTYAAWWVRHALNRALSDQSRTIRIPVHLLEARHRVARARESFSQTCGREPTETELSERAGFAAEKVRAVSSIPKEPVSMDAPLGAEGERRLGDLVADPDASSVLDEISAKHVRHRIRHLLQTLSPREQEVLRLRFGIDRPDGLTLEQVGRRLSVSRERARQIEAEALSKLRRSSAAEDLDSHLVG